MPHELFSYLIHTLCLQFAHAATKFTLPFGPDLCIHLEVCSGKLGLQISYVVHLLKRTMGICRYANGIENTMLLQNYSIYTHFYKSYLLLVSFVTLMSFKTNMTSTAAPSN